MNLYELFSGIAYDGEIPDVDIKRISCDPRMSGYGILNVIYKRIGTTQETHVMPSEAITVCEHDEDITGGRVIRVENARAALSILYSNLFKIDYDKLTFIGITGTNGKTTTATLCEYILRYAGKGVGFIGTGRVEYMGVSLVDSEYSMTTPDPSILYPAIKKMQNMGCTHIVMEVSSQAVALSRIAPINFAVCAFLNLSREHLDLHGGMEDYYGLKLALFKSARIGIFNRDDSYSKRAEAECGLKAIRTVGIINDADIGLCELQDKKDDGYEYICRSGDLYFKVTQHLPGAFNVYNVLFAIGITEALGIRNADIRRAIGDFSSVPGRCEIIKDEIRVIIDYAHTPRAMNELLTFAKGSARGKRVITLFGCGGERARDKRPLMAREAEKYSDLLFITEDNSRQEDPDIILADIISGLRDNKDIKIIPDRERAIKEAILMADLGDTVLIVGKGNEAYNDKGGRKRVFDERAIIRDALLMRRNDGRA